MLSPQIEARLKKVTTNNNIKSWLASNLPYYNSYFDSSIHELLGISQRTWYNYLNCATPVPHTVLAKLVIILEPWGCTFDDLIEANHD